ncbi:MAG TPA: alpha/beta fold hydrolase [Candidatus Limnocylindrales bacterium]|nr:alpha/beta fold hydrolase [Candidatus Limnocylindrales bacterium]
MAARAAPVRPEAAQEIRFCRSPDGARLAYAFHGSGPTLVVASCWLSHLEYDWQSPVWRHFLDDLGGIARLVRYDERGFGLSDWNVTDFSLEAQVADLEAVVDALGTERFALLGMSGNSPVALAYAARHPDRVTRLILYGGWAGQPPPAPSSEHDVEEAAYQAMVRAGWARPDPLFRRVFTNMFIPGATEIQMGWMDDLQRMSTSTENMLAARAERIRTDVAQLLPSITAPTLVLHARGDRAIDFKHARLLATSIPDARLVPLESRNHILLAGEPAWTVFMGEVRAFMAPEREVESSADDMPSIAALTAREREILRHASDGRGNEEIAEALTLSVRTVERHLSNAYLKLGISGRSARTAAVARLLRERG